MRFGKLLLVSGAAVVALASMPAWAADEDNDKGEIIVSARKQRPTWGPRKLRAYLMSINPGVQFPSVSAIADIIHRNGLTRTRRRRRQRLSCRARARSQPPPTEGRLVHRLQELVPDGRRRDVLPADAHRRLPSVPAALRGLA